MKKSIKAMAVSVGMAAVIGAFAPNANADISWVLSPNANAFAGSVTVVTGLDAAISFSDSSQPIGVYGAGFTYTGPAFSMDFDADLNTYDSYNKYVGGYTGYYDAFIVTVNTTGYYWDAAGGSPHTDPMPTGASTFVWGGTNWGDGLPEHYGNAPGTIDGTISLAGPGTFYVSIVLDTKSAPESDTLHPSWGSFHVTPVPEPETYAMLLAGLGLMGFVARRRRQNAAA